MPNIQYFIYGHSKYWITNILKHVALFCPTGARVELLIVPKGHLLTRWKIMIIC